MGYMHNLLPSFFFSKNSLRKLSCDVQVFSLEWINIEGLNTTKVVINLSACCLQGPAIYENRWNLDLFIQLVKQRFSLSAFLYVKCYVMLGVQDTKSGSCSHEAYNLVGKMDQKPMNVEINKMITAYNESVKKDTKGFNKE